MISFVSLRALAWLKRAALALERIASAQESTAEIAIARGKRERERAAAKPRPTDFGSLDQEAANEAWRRQLEEALIEPENAR